MINYDHKKELFHGLQLTGFLISIVKVNFYVIHRTTGRKYADLNGHTLLLQFNHNKFSQKLDPSWHGTIKSNPVRE